MEPKIWGKYVWTSLHVIALGYPDQPSEKDKANYKQFYTTFWHVIPCQKCADNYHRHLQELPPIDEHLTDSNTLFKWTVDLHNIVNKELGKRTYTYKEAHEIFARLSHGDHTGLGGVNDRWEKLALYTTYTIIAITVISFVAWIIKSRIKLRR
jgi:hypothetical protein